MRIVSRSLILATLLLPLCASRAAAEWQFAPFLGYTFKGQTTFVDPEQATTERHWHFGGSVRLLGDSPLGVEALYVHTPGYFERDEVDLTAADLVRTITESRTYALMGNIVLTTPRHWNQYGLRPYVSGGVGLMHVRSQDLGDAFPIRLNLLGMNLGGGAVGFLSEHVGVRFDLRFLRNIRGVDLATQPAPSFIPPLRLRYWTGSVGVVFKY